MNNTEYGTNYDFLPVREAFRGLGADQRREVKEILRTLERDPRPSHLGCKHLGSEVYKIATASNEVTILYRVDENEKEIELIAIKPRTAFMRAREWFVGLLKFEPME
jgi:mRNA-degrading endonuclease RelE of RelBE toxin-antitoxin system